MRATLRENSEGIGAGDWYSRRSIGCRFAACRFARRDYGQILAGDSIYLIDGVETAGMSVDEAVRRIRGPRGSMVVLTVSHNGIETIEDITITRDVIRLHSVTWDVTDDDIAIIRIAFNADTAGLFNEAVISVMQSNVDGIVLDLRNNPGGFWIVRCRWRANGLARTR